MLGWQIARVPALLAPFVCFTLSGAARMTVAAEHIKPELTVLVMTYNHQRFIGQALDAALAQRTDFPYEVVISEDCSTDGTRETVMEYARRYPDKIRLLLSPANVRS